MITGIGVDIVSLSRMANSIDRSGQVFIDKVFTTWEQEQAKIHGNQTAYYAMLFAGKEAIFKAFTLGWETGVQFKEIEISRGSNGEPTPILSGAFGKVASERSITQILLSLSYDEEYAIGMATVLE